MTEPRENPVLVEVYRNNVIESCHRGSVLVVDHYGKTIFSLGDVTRDVYPRSSIKLFQTLPLVESGAADHFNLTDQEIALACASHNAESIHVETVLSWLKKIDLDVESLENGPDLPLSKHAKYELLKSGGQPGKVHQNCSGKHTGMLTMAKYLGVSTKGYSEHDHPTQRNWMKSFSELIDIDVAQLPWERDGCGLPAICMSLERLAYGCALFANPKNLSNSKQSAIKRILNSIANHPLMIAGSNRFCTEIIEKTKGEIFVKTGAEGVFAGVVPSAGVGIALKIDDGATRGSEVAMGAVLNKLGFIDDEMQSKLIQQLSPKIFNSQGNQTGRIVPSDVWEI